MKAVLSILSLASLAYAVPNSLPTNKCAAVSGIVSQLHIAAGASQFCSSYLHISTSTVTVGATTTASGTIVTKTTDQTSTTVTTITSQSVVTQTASTTTTSYATVSIVQLHKCLLLLRYPSRLARLATVRQRSALHATPKPSPVSSREIPPRLANRRQHYKSPRAPPLLLPLRHALRGNPRRSSQVLARAFHCQRHQLPSLPHPR